MKELELKFLEIDKNDLVGRLVRAGAKLTCNGILKTIYFDLPNSNIENSGELFRLRTFGDKNELCRKINPRLEDGCKVYDEIEIYVSDFETSIELIHSLGYESKIVFEKKRIEYKLSDGSKFEIDEYPNVPVFVEIEAENFQRIQELAVEFRLTQYETSPLNAEDILCDKYKIDINNLVF